MSIVALYTWCRRTPTPTKDLGKPYSRICLSLCAMECVHNAEKELTENDNATEKRKAKSTNTANECKIVSVVKNSQPIRPFFNADSDCDVMMATSSLPALDSKVLTYR